MLTIALSTICLCSSSRSFPRSTRRHHFSSPQLALYYGKAVFVSVLHIYFLFVRAVLGTDGAKARWKGCLFPFWSPLYCSSHRAFYRWRRCRTPLCCNMMDDIAPSRTIPMPLAQHISTDTNCATRHYIATSRTISNLIAVYSAKDVYPLYASFSFCECYTSHHSKRSSWQVCWSNPHTPNAFSGHGHAPEPCVDMCRKDCWCLSVICVDRPSWEFMGVFLFRYCVLIVVNLFGTREIEKGRSQPAVLHPRQSVHSVSCFRTALAIVYSQ